MKSDTLFLSYFNRFPSVVLHQCVCRYVITRLIFSGWVQPWPSDVSIIIYLERIKKVRDRFTDESSVCQRVYVCVGVKFDMTAPVLIKVPEETKMWEPAIYTLSFLLPSAYQEKPPAPTNDKLYFSNMPDMDVYVRVYGGWMLSITSRRHSHLLTKALLEADAHYNHTHHYAVGYDSCRTGTMKFGLW